ncbi:MAG: hypothetical protein KA020_09270 [Planctomycetes bacterium]|nr:hypothetical protein [Planctomycetota bacterium]MCC7066293.1 hypothetical protein [Planctomycetota bacterium]
MTLTAKLISGIGFTPATSEDERHGLLGYVTCTFADLLLLDGLTLRVTAAGRHTLSFPSRTDGQGNRHPYFRPQDDRARRIIEGAVFRALGIPPEVKP